MKNKLLLILLILVLVKGFFWAVLTPIFQAPDENTHFGVIQFIGETNHHPGRKKALITSEELITVGQIVNFNWIASHPVWQGLPPDWQGKIKSLDPNLKDNFIHHFNQGGQKLPQAYYWLNWPMYKVFINQNFLVRFYALRLVSVLLGVATAYLSFLIGKLVFKSRSLSLAIASLVAFQPMASVIFSSITYDSLAIFIATLFLYLAVNFIKTKKSKYIWLTLIISLLSLTVKTQLVALLLVWPFLLTKKHLKKLILFTPLLFLIGLIKDYREIIFNSISWLTSGKILTSTSSYIMQNVPRMWAEIFPWYWGVFGWLEAVMPMWVYAILKLITFISLIGLGLYLYKNFKSRFKQYSIIKFFILFTFLTTGVVLINDFIIFTERSTVFGVQGRYFLPGIAAHMILLVLGITSLLPKSSHNWVGKLIIFFSVALNLIGLYSLIQYFGIVWV